MMRWRRRRKPPKELDDAVDKVFAYGAPKAKRRRGKDTVDLKARPEDEELTQDQE